VILAEDGPLAGALREAGARVEVLPLAPVARDVRRNEIRAGRKQAVAAALVAAYVPRVAARLRALSPDLVQTISLKSGVYGSLAARITGIPVLWHLHDNLSDDYLSPRTAATMRRVVTTLPNALAAPSESTLAAVGTRTRRLPTEVFRFPVPLMPAPAEVHPDVRTVGMVGRITPWKGQDVFLRAFARAFPAGPVCARVIGSPVFGEEQYERRLRNLVRELDIADRVEFAGFRRDVAAELGRLDLLVHASVLPDPLAGVVLEGMSAGVPTISSSAGGHAEYVAEGKAGLLYKAGDVDELADAMRLAADSYELRRELSAAGRRTAERFTPGAIVGPSLDFYRRIIGAQGDGMGRARRAAST
jgi:glycosyltransferase involved in cell wall biosynthesis